MGISEDVCRIVESSKDFEECWRIQKYFKRAQKNSKEFGGRGNNSEEFTSIRKNWKNSKNAEELGRDILRNYQEVVRTRRIQKNLQEFGRIQKTLKDNVPWWDALSGPQGKLGILWINRVCVRLLCSESNRIHPSGTQQFQQANSGVQWKESPSLGMVAPWLSLKGPNWLSPRPPSSLFYTLLILGIWEHEHSNRPPSPRTLEIMMSWKT